MFTPSKSDDQPVIPQPDRYVVYGWQRSYFTHKLMAALHFYGASWEYRDKTAANERELRWRSGTHQIPVLHTPENWMIADTTPLLHLLDARYSERRMFPAGVTGIKVQMLEEYFDEWIARTTVHWRWNYPENHELLSLDAAQGDEEAARALVIWGGKVCRATGVSSAQQQEAAEQEYLRILAAAEAALGSSAFLLGDQPTAVDCIVLAGLRAHFLYDPAPKKAIGDRYPRVLSWCHETADQWNGEGKPVTHIDDNGFAGFVLKEMANTYGPYALGNRAALAAGDKAFVIPVYGEDVSYLARPYIEQSRAMIAQRVASELSGTERQNLLAWLEPFGLDKVFLN